MQIKKTKSVQIETIITENVAYNVNVNFSFISYTRLLQLLWKRDLFCLVT